MRLQDLYKNFGESSPEEQLEFIRSYRLKRAKDLEEIQKVKESKTQKEGVELSSEEKALMKMLGLRQKDLKSLHSATTEVSEEVNDEKLFADDTFEGGEDE